MSWIKELNEVQNCHFHAITNTRGCKEAGLHQIGMTTITIRHRNLDNLSVESELELDVMKSKVANGRLFCIFVFVTNNKQDILSFSKSSYNITYQSLIMESVQRLIKVDLNTKYESTRYIWLEDRITVFQQIDWFDSSDLQLEKINYPIDQWHIFLKFYLTYYFVWVCNSVEIYRVCAMLETPIIAIPIMRDDLSLTISANKDLPIQKLQVEQDDLAVRCSIPRSSYKAYFALSVTYHLYCSKNVTLVEHAYYTRYAPRIQLTNEFKDW